MSNFCATSYYFEGDKQCLSDFYNKLKAIEDDATILDYRKKRWMTHLASVFGFEPSDFYCRGYFDNPLLDADNGYLTFDVESGNTPCEDLIDAILKYYDNRISVLWFVECPDDGEYFTNDSEGKVFKSRYEIYLEDIDSEWFESIPEALEWIKEKTGVIIPRAISNDVDKLYNYIISDLEEELDMCCNFHCVQIVQSAWKVE